LVERTTPKSLAVVGFEVAAAWNTKHLIPETGIRALKFERFYWASRFT
jgi:hypothetical protein